MKLEECLQELKLGKTIFCRETAVFFTQVGAKIILEYTDHKSDFEHLIVTLTELYSETWEVIDVR